MLFDISLLVAHGERLAYSRPKLSIQQRLRSEWLVETQANLRFLLRAKSKLVGLKFEDLYLKNNGYTIYHFHCEALLQT